MRNEEPRDNVGAGLVPALYNMDHHKGDSYGNV